ncbi:MAG: molecular chaperone, partial [Verrucomicrobiota bacterium]
MTKVELYLNVVTQYDKEFSKWMNRTDKILRRYRDDRQVNSTQTRYNMLWANVQTLKAATFSRMPKPDISRRFKDNDPVGRVASMILERAMDFEITHYEDLKHCLESSVYDRFLGGRGSAWVRYEPKIESMDYETSESDEESDEAAEYLDSEAAPIDYVHWKDFGHEPARTWDEVNKVWRKVYMTRKALVERFGEEVGNKVPLDSSPDDQKYKDSDGIGKKGLIIELWDRETETVLWISKSLNQILDERDDPLELEEFFPCPKPLYSTITNESLVPIPDFTLYQDQANALDILSTRISGLIDALKVRGVYDASEPTLQRLFTEGENNTLIPVKNWPAFSEKQGLRGAIDIVDITPIAMALKNAYDAMAQIKQEIYDITGISDIIRGQSNVIETATSAQIKSQFASLRLKEYQDAVACYASHILKLKAQVICGQFQPETLMKIGGVAQLAQEDQALVPQAIEMLKSNPMRTFRIEVATDSMLYQDEQQEKADRVEFLGAVGTYLEKAVQASQAMPPEATPLLMDLL